MLKSANPSLVIPAGSAGIQGQGWQNGGVQSIRSHLNLTTTIHLSVRGTVGEKFGFHDNAYQKKRYESLVGKHEDKEHSQDRTAVKWFVRFL